MDQQSGNDMGGASQSDQATASVPAAVHAAVHEQSEFAYSAPTAQQQAEAPVQRHEPAPAMEARVEERAPEPKAAPVVEQAAPAPVHAPAPVQAAVAPAAPVAKPEEIEQALKSSGLVLVQTRSDVKAELPPEPEFKPAKRERRPPPADLAVPMKQVDTRKDDNPPA